jgi:hypothetical protein
VSTIRVAKRDRFTSIDRRAINDERLSFRARGVLTWLLDKPDDWSATRETIASGSPEGVHAIRGALKELADLGYLVRTKIRLPNGRTVTETLIHEVPPEAENQPLVLSPEADYQPAVNQPVVHRPAVNRPAIDRRLIPKTDTEPAAAPAKSPQGSSFDASGRLARAEWDRRQVKPVCGFPALRTRIQEALDAGHSPDAVARVLPGMSVFSRNAFDFALRDPKTASPRTTEPEHVSNYDLLPPEQRAALDQMFGEA